MSNAPHVINLETLKGSPESVLRESLGSPFVSDLLLGGETVNIFDNKYSLLKALNEEAVREILKGHLLRKFGACRSAAESDRIDKEITEGYEKIKNDSIKISKGYSWTEDSFIWKIEIKAKLLIDT